MDNAPAVVEHPQVVITVEDAKKYFAPNASDKELYMFLNIANRLGLDPVKREVHFVKYANGPGQTVVGYQVYLKRAEATGKLNGWKVTIQGKGTKDEKAIITIYRKDREHPFEWEVFRSEVDKQQSVWKQMPQFMLKKVAISQGFRLAFPEELGGLPYIPEEINGGSTEELLKEEQQEKESNPKGYKAYLDAMASLKKDVGDTIYYGVLEPYGFKHANEIKDRETQKKIFKELDKIAAGMAKEEEEQLPLTPGET